jgi:hypothetical protein
LGGRTPPFTVLLETPLSVLRLTDSSHFNPTHGGKILNPC